ncbi:MAG TPA: SPASM domain-containing protein [Nitrososphaerales archaeon]|nr:SPASM domain-containing protein [Nitrososphaerales archaeon]
MTEILENFKSIVFSSYPRKIRSLPLKLYYNIYNLIQNGSQDLFNGVEIETITTCNRKCPHCPNAYIQREDAIMKEFLFMKIIDELAEIKFCGRISPHFYGEPLLDSRLPELMSYTRRKLPFAHIQIFTNGDFLSKELFDELVNRGVDDFCITQHSKLMPKKIKHFFNQLTINDWKKIQYRSIEEIQLSSREGLIPLKNLKKLEKCDFPSKTLIIDYKGRVILCCDDYLSNYSFGNINNEKLIDIWKKKEYTKVRRDLVNGIFRLNICTECGLGSLDINNTKIITAH